MWKKEGGLQYVTRSVYAYLEQLTCGQPVFDGEQKR